MLVEEVVQLKMLVGLEEEPVMVKVDKVETVLRLLY